MDYDAMTNTMADSSGIGNIFRSLATADTVRKKAEMDAGLRTAQAYLANMHGNKYGQEAEVLKYTLDNRKNIESYLEKNPDFADYLKNSLRIWGQTGKGDTRNIAQASGDLQKQAAIQDIQDGNADALRTGQAYFATSGKAPYANAKANGYTLNQLTGDQIEGNPIVAKLYRDLEISKTRENNAQAGAAGASAGLANERRRAIQQGAVMEGTDGNGKPVLYQYGTSRLPKILQDVFPLVKSGGAEAAATKIRGQVSREVYKDGTIMPEEREAEINRRTSVILGKGGGQQSGGSADDVLLQAKDAITKGAPRDKVIARLRSMGINPKGL